MHSAIFLTVLAASVAIAHSEAGNSRNGPLKMMGGSMFNAKLKNRNPFEYTHAQDFEAKRAKERSPVATGTQTRNPRSQTCGAGVGSCPAGYCCSSDGVCGQGIDYCEAPDCQFEYGPACDANTIPPGASTSGIARPQLGSVPYGVRINDCTKPGVIALTFDDGPYIYTHDLLDLLDKYNAKVTFFITGNNLGKGEIDDCSTGYPSIIQRMHASGHQIASHSWSHQDLVGLSQTYFNHQIYYNEMAFRNILGFFPTYFRPPYVDCDSECFDRLTSVGYHVIYYDLDTFDYLNDDPNLIQNSKNYFSNYITQDAPNPATGNMMSLSHDTHYQTVYNLTEFMLQTIAAQGYGTSVTVGDCLGDPPVNWYRAAGTPMNCTVTPLTVSTVGNCTNGITCLGSTFGNCCSQYRWCGSTPDYCGTGCQDEFGTCGVSSSPSSPSSTPTLSSTATNSTTSPTSITPTTPPTSSSPPTTTLSTAISSSTSAMTVSSSGLCGNGVTCLNSPYGNCCSRYGFCGSTADYCGPFCQPAFGTCSPSSSNNSTGLIISTDGSCGKGITCLNSTFGNCCSQYGFCGNTTAYCSTGCNDSYGSCT